MPPQQTVDIIIDKQHVKAPKPVMTGSELRALHKPPIGPDRDLFLKVPGPGDDLKIGDSDPIELKNGMHFFSVPSQINPGLAA
jgi:hypothetical protein